MTERMSAAQYLAMTKGVSVQRVRSSGNCLRLPDSFVADRTAKLAAAALLVPVEAPVAAKVSSAQAARNRVLKTVDALEKARTQVEFFLRKDGTEHAVVRVIGGETLPPNRAMNIGREQSKLSQRSFSRYKHACADRMNEAAMLLLNEVRKVGLSRFNANFDITHISYVRQVVLANSCIDEDAVAYSFKYVLDGLVSAGVLVDDSRRYVRIRQAEQEVGDTSMLVIELETRKASA